MISSLPIFILTAAKLAAPPVANRPAMPIDCRNTDSRAGQRIDLTCFSRLAVQLCFLWISESMGNHDSNVVGAGRVC